MKVSKLLPILIVCLLVIWFWWPRGVLAQCDGCAGSASCGCENVCGPSSPCTCCNSNVDCYQNCCPCAYWSCSATIPECVADFDCGGDSCRGGECCYWKTDEVEWGCCSSEGGCFTAETQVELPSGETKPIAELEVGESVASYDPEAGQPSTGLVEKVFEVTESTYYKIKLKDGQEIEATSQHPLYSVAGVGVPASFWEFFKTESLLIKGFGFLFK